MVLAQEQKREVITKYRLHEKDTGSPEVQVAILTRRIEELKRHFDLHEKDHGSRQGLLKMVGQRRKLLNYLKRNKAECYQKLIDELNIRK